MPLLTIKTSARLDDAKKKVMLSELSKLVAQSLGKPEKYVMVIIEEAPIFMSGSEGVAAFADLRSIGGIDRKINKTLSGKLCSFLKEKAGIPIDRIYCNFTDVSGENWGWNGDTFG